MYGLEAISAQNGWAMAIAGALIVMAGLAVLSFVISQLHKIAAFLEKRTEKRSEKKQAVIITPKEAVVPKPPAFDIDEAQARLKPLVAELGESFELTNLYELANSGELPHVHLSIRSLRESGVIVPAGDGRFVWRD
ncbi:MAG: OadG family protein [Desulfobacterales bacterium]